MTDAPAATLDPVPYSALPLSDHVRSIQGEAEYTDTDIFEWLSSLPAEFVTCRLFLHAWQTDFEYRKVKVGDRIVREMTLLCMRCGAEKTPRVSVEDGRIKHHGVPPIFYPEGYLAPYGMTVTRAHVREWVARQRGGIRVRGGAPLRR